MKKYLKLALRIKSGVAMVKCHQLCTKKAVHLINIRKFIVQQSCLIILMFNNNTNSQKYIIKMTVKVKSITIL